MPPQPSIVDYLPEKHQRLWLTNCGTTHSGRALFCSNSTILANSIWLVNVQDKLDVSIGRYL
jgi:hypothetical protein